MIQTKRLTLVPLTKEHANGLFVLWSHNEVIKYTYTIFKNNIKECEDWIEGLLESLKEVKHIGPYTIFLNNKIIGFMGAPTVDLERKEYRFFYQFDIGYWGKGYGYEVAHSLMKRMFEVENVETIYADAVPINIASVKILEKLGMTQTGRTKDGFKKEEIGLDLLNFKITKSEWENNIRR